MGCPAFTPPTTASDRARSRREPTAAPADPNRPIAIPRDPDRDLALGDCAQKVLKAILRGTTDDPRLPGRRRWCAWMSNQRIQEILAQMGQPKGHSYVDRGLAELGALGRIDRKSMSEFGQWLIEQAPRHGMPCDLPPSMLKRKGRVIIITAELPPVVSEAYGPLKLQPSDELSTLLNLRCDSPQIEERAHPNLRSANRRENSIDLPETETIPSTSRPEKIDDGIGLEFDGEELLDDQTRRWLRLPENRWEHRFAVQDLRRAIEERDRPAPIPTPPVATVAPTPAPTIARTPEPEDASESRPGRQAAQRIAREGQALFRTGDMARADRLLTDLLDLVGGRHDRDLRAVAANATRRIATGEIAGDAFFGIVIDLPNKGMRTPRGFLRNALVGIGAQKDPSPVYLPQFPATDPANQTARSIPV